MNKSRKVSVLSKGLACHVNILKCLGSSPVKLNGLEIKSRYQVDIKWAYHIVSPRGYLITNSDIPRFLTCNHAFWQLWTELVCVEATKIFSIKRRFLRKEISFLCVCILCGLPGQFNILFHWMQFLTTSGD